MLLWRVFAAQEWAARLGSAVLPAIFVILSSVAMWVLLTIVAVALSQQPKIRRALMKELADYNANAEARALARENEQARPSGASAADPTVPATTR
jgi:hypothetical protein